MAWASEVAHGHKLYQDRSEKDALEARNGRLQYQQTIRFIEESYGSLKLTSEIVKALHYAAIRDIYSCAGQYRTWPVKIPGSSHKPPHFKYVPGLVDQMCDEVNQAADWSPLKTAAYLLWKVNWIHPFGGGNRRTARAVCYLGLSVRFGSVLPGQPTIPEQIVNDRKAFQNALRDADKAWELSSEPDVSRLESLLDGWLKKQLASVFPPKP